MKIQSRGNNRSNLFVVKPTKRGKGKELVAGKNSHKLELSPDTKKVTFNCPVPEQDIIESCLNMAHQINKNQASFIIGMYSLFNRWKIGKLIYYLKEMGIKNE